MTPTVVEAHSLRKSFAIAGPLRRRILSRRNGRDRIRALEDVSIRAAAGEILGIVGPNGAGKTTLLRILADLMEPDSGWVEICGQRLHRGRDQLRSMIGYVSSDERSFFWRLSGRHNLEFFAGLYGVDPREKHQRITSLLDSFSLREKATQLFRDYSSGTRKKFAVMRALIHQPKVVLLDEATNSLDPPSAGKVKTLLRDYVRRQEGRVALWSTHRLEEVGEICDRVVTIDGGRVGFYGSAGEFTAASRQVTACFNHAGADGPALDGDGVLQAVARSLVGPQEPGSCAGRLSTTVSGGPTMTDH